MVWRSAHAKPGDTEARRHAAHLPRDDRGAHRRVPRVKAYRDKVLGGVIRFLPALGVGLGHQRRRQSIIYVIAWEVSMAYSSFDFIAFYKAYLVDAAKAKGASGAELNQAIADAESFATMYMNPLYRMPMTFIEMFPVGLLISLITAAILRNSRVLPAQRMGSGPVY